MSNTKNIGNKIAEARKKTNISQAQLADRLFISSQAVGKWERGESMPDITTFSRMAEILGVDLNYFSDNFPSTAGEVKPSATLMEQPVEAPVARQGKKLNWDMSRGNWADADFSGLKNLHEKFSGSNMQRCKFIGSDLSGLLLQGNNVDTCDFSDSVIKNSQIQGSNIANTQFKKCTLQETEFTGSFVGSCDFTEADFTGMTLKSGGFEKNKIENAVWNHTSFKDSYLADLVFDGNMDDCYFENCAFKRVIFQNATITNTFFKNGKWKLKGIKFINCQADRMTYEFLKNGKADLKGLTQMAS